MRVATKYPEQVLECAGASANDNRESRKATPMHERPLLTPLRLPPSESMGVLWISYGFLIEISVLGLTACTFY
jgi:hypothetical protein